MNNMNNTIIILSEYPSVISYIIILSFILEFISIWICTILIFYIIKKCKEHKEHKEHNELMNI